jgi:glycosyltransferase involved in cell wall biosynthesis
LGLRRADGSIQPRKPVPDAPVVCVVIPVYNGAASIGRAIASALAQTFRPSEIIVVDDGSTDATQAALYPFGKHIKVIKQANMGPAVARNVAIDVARGEFIAFLDADDVWLPEKLQLLVAALRLDESAVLAFSDAIPVDENGYELAPALLPRAFAHAPSIGEMLGQWWPIYPSAVLIRRATVLACGGFDAGFRRPGYEDPLLWLLARKRGGFTYVDAPLLRYRHMPELQRMIKYAPGLPIFADRVRSHFGATGEVLIANLLAAHLSVLNHEGLIAMAAGEMRRARTAFRTALRLDRCHTRTLSRLARAHLPFVLASALSSPRRRKRWAIPPPGTTAISVEG